MANGREVSARRLEAVRTVQRHWRALHQRRVDTVRLHAADVEHGGCAAADATAADAADRAGRRDAKQAIAEIDMIIVHLRFDPGQERTVDGPAAA